MVRFTNIVIKEGFIHAIAVDLMEGCVSSIRVTLDRNSGEYYASHNMTNNMVKALWNLRTCYYDNNCTLPSKKTIVWG